MRDYRQFIGRTVVVSLIDESTFSGVLDRVLRESLVLASAKVSANRADVSVDGSVVIPADSIVWVQIP